MKTLSNVCALLTLILALVRSTTVMLHRGGDPTIREVFMWVIVLLIWTLKSHMSGGQRPT